MKKNIVKFITLFLMAVFIDSVVFGIYQISSVSMFPTYETGDIILVTKYSYNIRTPSKIPFFDISIPYFRYNGFENINEMM